MDCMYSMFVYQTWAWLESRAAVQKEYLCILDEWADGDLIKFN